MRPVATPMHRIICSGEACAAGGKREGGRRQGKAQSVKGKGLVVCGILDGALLSTGRAQLQRTAYSVGDALPLQSGAIIPAQRCPSL